MRYHVTSQEYDHDLDTTITANNMTHALFIVRKLCNFRYIEIVDEGTPTEENRVYGIIVDEENAYVDETYDGYSHQTVSITATKEAEAKPASTLKWEDKEFVVTEQDEIKAKIINNPTFAVKCLKELYQYQTAEEQSYGDTVELNGVGFSGADANILSSFANQVNSWDKETSKFNFPLSPKQLALLQKKLPKYAKQLSLIFSKED